jgi:hypothetical protein
VITGECSVEGLTGADHQVLLEGLRLRLDLRIMPRAKGKDAVGAGAGAAAVWRIEDARIATLPLGVPLVYQRAALISGLSVLALSIAFWLARPSTTSSFEAASAPPRASSAAAPVANVPAAPSPMMHEGSSEVVAPRVAPRISTYRPGDVSEPVASSAASPTPAVAAAPAPARAIPLDAAPAPSGVSSSPAPPGGAGSFRRVEPSSVARSLPLSMPPSTARVDAASTAGARVSSAPAALGMSQREMLELFGDTK